MMTESEWKKQLEKEKKKKCRIAVDDKGCLFCSGCKYANWETQYVCTKESVCDGLRQAWAYDEEDY